MQYQKIFGRSLAVAVGGFLVARPLTALYVRAYPIGTFLKQLLGVSRVDALEYLALLAMLIYSLVQISAGMLIVSFGFDALQRARKPLMLTTGFLAVPVVLFMARIAL